MNEGKSGGYYCNSRGEMKVAWSNIAAMEIEGEADSGTVSGVGLTGFCVWIDVCTKRTEHLRSFPHFWLSNLWMAVQTRSVWDIFEVPLRHPSGNEKQELGLQS